MPASSLLALIDDITTILDDISVLTKVAAKKTAGVLGDDLALNAQQVSGVNAERELPVVWAVAKGSALNKAILVPAALAISAFAPWGVTPLLMAGGAFLCYEGVEKLAHKRLHSAEEDAAHHQALTQALVDSQVDLLALENEKIKGAIRTDFILSAEIITISLGAVAEAAIGVRVGTLTAVAVIMTVGVYGLVAAIVKLDDLGLYLRRRPSPTLQRLGAGIVRAAPWLMKALSVAGTAAMFLVGGGILVHAVPALHHGVESLQQAAGPWLGPLAAMVANGASGVVAGAIVLSVVSLLQRLRRGS